MGMMRGTLQGSGPPCSRHSILKAHPSSHPGRCNLSSRLSCQAVILHNAGDAPKAGVHHSPSVLTGRAGRLQGAVRTGPDWDPSSFTDLDLVQRGPLLGVLLNW